MKVPNLSEYRAWMYDAQCQEIMGNEAVPAGTRLDKRIARPKERFYTSIRADDDSVEARYGPHERGRKEYAERSPFLARNTRDQMPVPSASNHERPKRKKYK